MDGQREENMQSHLFFKACASQTEVVPPYREHLRAVGWAPLQPLLQDEEVDVHSVNSLDQRRNLPTAAVEK